MRPTKHLIVVLWVLTAFSCTTDPADLATIGVDFDWQPIDYSSSENPEIRLSHVKLIDLDVKTYDHGGGFVENDGTGIISRGSVKGTFNGPAPWFEDMVHDYQITVTAYNGNDSKIGIGKCVRKYTHGIPKQ